MDLIYGKRSSENKPEEASKKAKLHNTNLPTHLPTLPTEIFGGSTSDKKDGGLVHKAEGDITSSNQKPAPIIPGTDIVLESTADIDEWIRKRKENWMKKISSRREEKQEAEKEGNTEVAGPKEGVSGNPESLPIQPQKRDSRQNYQRSKGNQNTQNRPTDPRLQNRTTDPRLQNRQNNYNRNRSQPQRFNLNNAIIQRELSRENATILDVIKELFDRGVVPKP